jgi:hypothetical protein
MGEENAAEENPISNRRFSPNFISPLTVSAGLRWLEAVTVVWALMAGTDAGVEIRGIQRREQQGGERDGCLFIGAISPL